MKKYSSKGTEMLRAGSRGNGQFRNFTDHDEVRQAGFDAADNLIKSIRPFERQSLPPAPRKQSLKDMVNFIGTHK